MTERSDFLECKVRRHGLLPLLAVVWVVVAVGCGDTFEDYNRVKGLRVLGIKADKPTLFANEMTTLSALVSDNGATYEWRFCPLTSGQSTGFECAVTEAELQEAADNALGPGVVELPSYDLGRDSTATFAYSFPAALLRGVCSFFLREGGSSISDLDSLPSCEDQYEVNIRLTVKGRGDEQIVAVRDLVLRFDNEQANENPVLAGAFFRENNSGDEFEVLPESSPARLRWGVEYELRLDIDEANAETFPMVPDGASEPVLSREDLTVTWFLEVGNFSKTRTSFLDGNTTFENLRTNFYTPPVAGDSSESQARLWFVIRDNRGGLSFLSRNIEMVP